jgi:hypothetical protein
MEEIRSFTFSMNPEFIPILQAQFDHSPNLFNLVMGERGQNGKQAVTNNLLG